MARPLPGGGASASASSIIRGPFSPAPAAEEVISGTGPARRLPRRLPPRGDERPLPDDGYVWLKYGQKPLLPTNGIRSYYKCAQKQAFGCQAKKTVEVDNGDQLSARVQYTGAHSHERPSGINHLSPSYHGPADGAVRVPVTYAAAHPYLPPLVPTSHSRL